MDVPAWEGHTESFDYPALPEATDPRGKKRRRKEQLKQHKDLQRLLAGTVKLHSAAGECSGSHLSNRRRRTGMRSITAKVSQSELSDALPGTGGTLHKDVATSTPADTVHLAGLKLTEEPSCTLLAASALPVAQAPFSASILLNMTNISEECPRK